MQAAKPRYWVYSGERVVGPYDPLEVSRLPVFDAELPLCEEDLLGTPAECWRRAADAAEFSAAFPESERTPPGVEPPKVGPWPPDPERSAVDALGTAQERMGIIDRSLEATQKRLSARREAYERLKRDMAARVAAAAELEEKVRAMGHRVGGYLNMKEELDQARAALSMQGQKAAELESQLKRVEEKLRKPPPPAKQERRSRPRRAGPDPFSDVPKDSADLGLPPATSFDVPDFS
ncbi:MAG: hypothetical protein HYZ75_12830 [Elusimicrobia bacterium]|nr:hypothetical protein [Elusimicrobiota bacterium]